MYLRSKFQFDLTRNTDFRGGIVFTTPNEFNVHKKGYE